MNYVRASILNYRHFSDDSRNNPRMIDLPERGDSRNPEQVIPKSELGHTLIGDHKSYESILRP